MTRKGRMESLPENIPNLEEPYPIFLFSKATKIPRGQTTDVSKFPLGFMLRMDFSFFIVESIRGFASTFVAICPATLCPFGFTSRRKRSPLDILKFLVNTLRNQEMKSALIRVDE